MYGTCVGYSIEYLSFSNQGGFFSLQRRRTPAPPPPVPVVDNPGEAAQRPADQDAPHEGPGAAPQGEVGRDNQEDPAQEQDVCGGINYSLTGIALP